VKTRRVSNWKGDAKRADDYISYCNTCKRCWERKFLKGSSGRSRNKINHYSDFVSYGRTRKECLTCQKEALNGM